MGMTRMEVEGIEEKMPEEIGDTGLGIILGSFPFPVSERCEQGSSSFEEQVGKCTAMLREN